MISNNHAYALNVHKNSKISLIVFIIGALFIIVSSGASIESVPLTYEFGLMQMLPPLFWLGFILCLISIMMGIKSDSRMVFYMKSLLLYLFINSIPILFLKNPFCPGSYSHIFESLPITLTGHVPKLSSDIPWVFESYPASFPGYFIFLSVLLQITGMDAMMLSKYYPFLSSMITFIVISLLYKTFLKGISQINYRYAILLFMLGNVYLQFQVSPQSLYFIVGFLMIIALERNTPNFRFIATFLFFSIVISHPTTLFIVLPFVVLLRFMIIVYYRNKNDSIIHAPAVLFTSMWLFWMIFFATKNLDTIIKFTFTQFRSIFALQILSQEANTRLEGIFTVPPLIRLILLTTFGLFSMSNLIMELREKNRNFPIHVSLLFTPVIMTVLNVAMGPSLYDRFFSFFIITAIPLSVIFIYRLRPHLKNILLTILFILAALNFTTIHYLSAQFVYSDETLLASKFADTFTDTQIYGSRIYFGLLPNFDDPYSTSVLRLTPFHRIYPISSDQLKHQSIIVLDYMTRNYYEVRGTSEFFEFYERNIAMFSSNKVYESGRYSFWVLN